MALKLFVGRATVRARIERLVVTSATAGNVAGASVGPTQELYTIPSGVTTDQVASALWSQLSASRAAVFNELTYSVVGSIIFVTSYDPSVDFDINPAGTSGVVTNAVDQTCTGPFDFGNADNYGGTLPVNGDSLTNDMPDSPITVNLDAQSGVTIVDLVLRNRANKGAGLNNFRRSGSSIYREYRKRYLEFAGLTTIRVEGDGQGPDVFNVRTGSNNVKAFISSGNTDDNDGFAPIQLLLTGTGNVVNCTRGYVGIPNDELLGVSATVATVYIGREGDNDTAPFVDVTGTATNVNNYSGSSRCSTATTLLMGRDAVQHDQLGGNLTLTGRGGRTIFRPNATITAALDGRGAVLDLNRSANPKTLGTGSSAYNGAGVIDPYRTAPGAWAMDAASVAASRLGDGQTVS